MLRTVSSHNFITITVSLSVQVRDYSTQGLVYHVCILKGMTLAKIKEQDGNNCKSKAKYLYISDSVIMQSEPEWHATLQLHVSLIFVLAAVIIFRIIKFITYLNYFLRSRRSQPERMADRDREVVAPTEALSKDFKRLSR